MRNWQDLSQLNLPRHLVPLLSRLKRIMTRQALHMYATSTHHHHYHWHYPLIAKHSSLLSYCLSQKCDHCRSMFISERHLENHKRRRHASAMSKPGQAEEAQDESKRPATVSDIENIVSTKVTNLFEQWTKNLQPLLQRSRSPSPMPSHDPRSVDDAVERALAAISSKQNLEMVRHLHHLDCLTCS